MAVQDGLVDRAVVPIENALEGGVAATLDALAGEADRVRIAAEVVHPIHHCLVAGHELALEDVTRVVSHPQASAQCARFLRERLPAAERVTAPSTADAVHDGPERRRHGGRARLAPGRRALRLPGARRERRGPAGQRDPLRVAGPRRREPRTRAGTRRPRSSSGAPATSRRAGWWRCCASSRTAA